ncbi:MULTISPECIES: cytochrome c biogenesis protein DipZ [unclassified Janthinobacterium]|uniref:cytochrome c biogenesis protein DipZ n=1 Tax=unclassified Janthinobacterium TaxID=2610881 RepID=UPI00160CF4D2|nr:MULTISPECIES: cytochrome c biogenesis protein DipZ [unclassified Janthinobacterium]MBB5368213.1 cytochrome c biogenesis protein CcdA/thiol-disulfide isomerase/thioredoxin [Janthinobacterium sp. K2C7]MBB5382250.1 cytochrome c biogenesis protein CcdA/thiol-disulfide isomerase/thioredoxin [Janthinobacterium sp. K2Li3]MBB5386595.1 cytochrome c biogenesis protein CcdA/thiol-disulfide isomerase/thioredoxin [Janthinobacterium sp. K2E3]
MLLLLLSYLGGALTIVSPCILPVLPFVFARSSEPFRRSGLPLLAGMALTFAAVATLAAVGGGWVVQANQYGRWLAMALMAFFGVTLLLPRLAEKLTAPLVALGSRLSNAAQQPTADGKQGSISASFLLGIATGLLWAPCAGPILGLVLTGAALNGASVGTTFLLLAYAAGAATSLAVALLIGGKVFTAMKRSLGAGEWIRRGLGLAMLAGVAAIALGLDTGLLTKVSNNSTTSLEQSLLDKFKPKPAAAPAMAASNAMMAAASHTTALPSEGPLPPLDGAVQWLNSPPLTAASLKGKVVLVDFWTYSCINCLRSLPYVKAWAAKYHDQGLVVIGVHAPEFAFERDIGNVRKAVKDLGINYPVAIDNDYSIWRAFSNEYWPAHYFIDAKGQIRGHHFGEGEYAESEKIIQQLLAEAGNKNVAGGVVSGMPDATGVEQASNGADVGSPETYLGTDRASNFASPGGEKKDRTQRYTAPAQLVLNQWALEGSWHASGENVALTQAPGRIVYRFHARDVHLVLGPGKDGKPVRFKVTLDGVAPKTNHGSDIDADGSGTVTGQRLYQLLRLDGPVMDHTFSIEFLDPGVQAYAFTFG